MNIGLKYVTEAERARIPDDSFAGPNHTFPIDTQAHVFAAAHLYGRAADPQAVRARIIEIAKRRGFSLPEGWETGPDTDQDTDDSKPGKSADNVLSFKTVPFELKSASGDGSEFEGYGNAFHNIDTAQEIVASGAFKRSIEKLMAEGSTDVIFLGGINHQWDSPIGKVTSAKEDAKGLFVQGKISPTQHGKDCMVLLKDGVLKKMSIGYKVLSDEMLDGPKEVADYWKSVGYKPSEKDIAMSRNGARLLTNVHLYEVSPVVAPANDMADITRVKRYTAGDLQTKRAFERFLRDSGLSRTEAVTAIGLLFKGLQRDADEAASPEVETPPDEPDTPTPSPIPPEPETQENEKQEPPTEAAPVVVADPVPVVEKADSRLVSARFANFLTFQARIARV